MTLGLLEDETLYELAKTVVTADGCDVENAQITGLLSCVRSSRSWARLRKMSQHQLEKARKDGEWGESRAAFYDRLFRALDKVEKYAEEHLRTKLRLGTAKLDRQQQVQKDNWAGDFALMLMTHVAAEHRWQRSSQ